MLTFFRPPTRPGRRRTGESDVPEQQAGWHVLFVEDEPDLLTTSVMLLERLGFRVTGVTSGTDALTALARGDAGFDILITDYFMPGMDGLTLIREARQVCGNLPVIVLSGMGTAIDQAILDPLAPVRVLGKPARREDLVTAIWQAVDGAERAG